MSVSGSPQMTAATVAKGNPTNQANGNPHQVPVPFARPTPQVVNVAAVTPIMAANASIEILRRTVLAVECTDSPCLLVTRFMKTAVQADRFWPIAAVAERPLRPEADVAQGAVRLRKTSRKGTHNARH